MDKIAEEAMKIHKAVEGLSVLEAIALFYIGNRLLFGTRERCYERRQRINLYPHTSVDNTDVV